MKAAVWVDAGKIIMEERGIPEAGLGEVLVETRAVGICGTDIHIYTGNYPGISPPRVLGHEACGEVVAVGKNINKDLIGKSVIVDPILWCGQCDFCKEGLYNLCAINGGKRLIGYSRDGAYTQYFTIPATNLHPFDPVKITFKEAALVDTLACPINAISKVRFTFNTTVVVVGCGSAGLLFVQLARLKGVKEIISIEPNESRRTLSEKLGASMALDPGDTNFEADLRAILPEKDLVIIEAAGTGESAKLALKMCTKNSILVYYGYVSNESIQGFDLGSIVFKEAKVLGSVGYALGNYEQSIELIGSGRVNVKPLITHEFRLEEIEKAFAKVQAQSDGLIKAIILQ